MLGYAATLDVRHVPTVVCDLDRSTESRKILRDVLASGYFEEVGRAERSDRVAAWLDDGRAVIGIVVPRGFGAKLAAGGRTTLEAVVDGSNSTEATTALGQLQAIVLEASIEIAVARLPPGASGGRPQAPVTAEMRVWYNEAMQSSHFMVPGVIALILMITTMLLTAIAVAREREIGTIDQILVTPIRATEFLIGKLIPYSLLGLFNVGVVLTVGRFWFGVPLRGSLVLLYALAFAFLLSTLGAGLLAATLSATQQQALLLCMGFVTPNMLLSGFIFPIENMPRAIQTLTYVMPVRYFLTIIRGILLKGVGLDVLWPQAVALSLLGAGIFVLSLVAFRTRA